ncbi:MAG: 2-oxo acid dehydrogenase subunit E2, partial [Prolixibacteraceae bacterium]|nr:2-oxo acid dehydrogenase subunit E2 [Prolixibacteraceae bacterium]
KFSTKKFPASRIASIDVVDIGLKQHHIKALLEADVTLARNQIKLQKKAGKKISVTGWLLYVIAKTVDENNDVHAFLKNKRSKVIFENINISLMIERKVGDEKVPIACVIKNVQEKDPVQLTQEIEELKNTPVSENDSSLNSSRLANLLSIYTRLPGFLRRSIWNFILKRPGMAHRAMGSVMVTSVGMFGKVKGWFIPTSVHPLAFGLGAITEKPGIIKGVVMPREYLYLTVLMNHDVVDGAPMARFINKLVKNIESAYGLETNN